ncbi:MAG TPA: hypothetical protein EYM65_11180 [Dehalococcoidia bacterium]|nr:hypothetical protein [Dehalococcoidia bacterium]
MGPLDLSFFLPGHKQPRTGMTNSQNTYNNREIPKTAPMTDRAHQMEWSELNVVKNSFIFLFMTPSAYSCNQSAPEDTIAIAWAIIGLGVSPNLAAS